jgi:hypothetical protein
MPARGRAQAARGRRGDRRDQATRRRSRRSPPPVESLRTTRAPQDRLRRGKTLPSSREPSPQCARTAETIASATSRVVISAPFAYDPYRTRRSTRSGKAAANAIAVQPPDEPPMSDTRSSSNASTSACSVAASRSRVRSDSRTVRSDLPTPSRSYRISA